MKNNFTADGYQRWLNGCETARRKAAPTTSPPEGQGSSFLAKIRNWWRKNKDREKSSAKILW